MWSAQDVATIICILGVSIILCLCLFYLVMHIRSLLSARHMRVRESAREVAISGADHGGGSRSLREGGEIELQNAEGFAAAGNEGGPRVEIVGVPIENRVRPRARLPRGVVIVPHEDEEVYIDFRKLPEIPEAEPPPPTEEELRRMMEEKSRVASPEFYGRSEYIEYHSSARNTPQHIYSGSFSIKQGKHGGNAGFYAPSVSSSCSMQSFYEPKAPYAVSLQSFLEHYRHRQHSDNLFMGSFRESGDRPGSSQNNSQNVVYPAMESTSDEFDDSGSDRGGSVRQEICSATCENNASLLWQRIRGELQPNGFPSHPYGTASAAPRSSSTLSSSNAFHPSVEMQRGGNPPVSLHAELFNSSRVENDDGDHGVSPGGRGSAGRTSPSPLSRCGGRQISSGRLEKQTAETVEAPAAANPPATASSGGSPPLRATPRKGSSHRPGSRLSSPVPSASSLEAIVALRAHSSGCVSGS